MHAQPLWDWFWLETHQNLNITREASTWLYEEKYGWEIQSQLASPWVSDQDPLSSTFPGPHWRSKSFILILLLFFAGYVLKQCIWGLGVTPRCTQPSGMDGSVFRPGPTVFFGTHDTGGYQSCQVVVLRDLCSTGIERGALCIQGMIPGPLCLEVSQYMIVFKCLFNICWVATPFLLPGCQDPSTAISKSLLSTVQLTIS